MGQEQGWRNQKGQEQRWGESGEGTRAEMGESGEGTRTEMGGIRRDKNRDGGIRRDKNRDGRIRRDKSRDGVIGGGGGGGGGCGEAHLFGPLAHDERYCLVTQCFQPINSLKRTRRFESRTYRHTMLHLTNRRSVLTAQ